MNLNCVVLLFIVDINRWVVSETFKEDNHNIDGLLKYLPEFNIDQTNLHKWSKYYEKIQQANLDYAQSKQNTTNSVSSSCDLFLPLVNSDLSFFEDLFGSNFFTKEMIDQIKLSGRAIHYQIIDHKLYRERSCLFPSRCEGIEHFLRGLLDKLDDMDLFINVRDYPQVGRYYLKHQQLPIFSFSKDVENYADITYPAWTFWSGGPAIDLYPSGIGRWDLMRKLLLNKQSKLTWEDKNKIAFFRGSRTSAQRDPIILLGRSRPDLVDAKYTKNQAWRSKADTLGDEPAKTVSFEDHCQYRYLFNAHGVAASFRLKHLFLCRSLVLNIDSDWIEFFYPPLKPWIHFVPLAKDLSNTLEVLEFLNENQPIAAHIANRGFEFIRDHLTIDSIECYWRNLLKSYSERIVLYRPNKPDQDLIPII